MTENDVVAYPGRLTYVLVRRAGMLRKPRSCLIADRLLPSERLQPPEKIRNRFGQRIAMSTSPHRGIRRLVRRVRDGAPTVAFGRAKERR